MLRSVAKRLRIQYASDLHLEIYGDKMACQQILKPVAPVLVLAGDVGNPTERTYRDLLHYCSRNWTDTFLVAGNHEFYNRKPSDEWAAMPAGKVHTVAERMVTARATVAEFSNVHLLDRRRVDRHGVAFLGATLWTDLSRPEDAKIAEQMMNDFRLICTDARQPLRAGDVTAWHLEDRAWLDREISACEEEGRPAVVVTHHLPTRTLIPSRFRDSPLNAAFASDCDDLIRSPVRAWIAGHTHTGIHRAWRCPRTEEVIYGGVNPRGYPGEAGGYVRDLFMDISLEPGNGGDTRDPLLVAAATIPVEEGDEDIEFR
jgi:hypothetical protein